MCDAIRWFKCKLKPLKKCQLQAYHPNFTLHANNTQQLPVRHETSKKTCKEAIKLQRPTSKDKCLSFDKH